MRTKNIMKTFLFGVLFNSIIAILGLIKTKVLLNNLGSEYVGLYQLFYQIFLYISLVEGGIGASVTYHLYKPVNDNDTKKINEIFNGAKYYFKIIGILIIAIGIILSLGIMFLIKETSIASWYVRICFILFILSSSANYFTFAHGLIYEAEQRSYKSSNYNNLLSIFESIVAIIVAILGGDLLLILTIFLVMSIIKNIIFIRVSKKDHPYIHKTKNKDISFKKEANALVVTKIGTLINENVDILILSKFVNLTYVFIYTAYNQIIEMIKIIVQYFKSAVLPSLGNLLVTEKEKAKDLFYELNSLLFYVGNLLFAPIFYMLTPFIGLWYGSDYKSTTLVSFLFVILLYIKILSISLENYIKATGKFKNIRNSEIYQSITNLVLSIILVHKYKIAGILFATVFAFFSGTFIHYPRVICKDIINDKTINYYKKCLKAIFGLMINLGICYFVFMILPVNNLFMWFISGVIMFVVNFIITTVYFYITNEKAFFERFKYLIRSKLRK